MTTQIAVRLADSLVEFIDHEVAAGRATSRADLVTRALERERRRLLAARDASILAIGIDGPSDDLAVVTRHLHGRPIDLD